MDLGIAGKKALVCASSEGLGKACAVSLSREGVHVYINGRTQETLEATADEIRAEGGEVRTYSSTTTPGLTRWGLPKAARRIGTKPLPLT
jgi:3-oxoacyl-[acyl-carrier protein] reductase